MAREWTAECKDCRKPFGYSNDSQQLSERRGLSRPERCPECRRLHAREIATLGLSHFDLTPIQAIPATGLQPGRLGGLVRPPRVHTSHDTESTYDLSRFGIKDEHIREYLGLLQQHQITVIVAPTGAGKSTFLPYRLMVPPDPFTQDLLTRHGQIIVTQPRIQATRNIPQFVARDLNGSSLGAGFDVGFRHSGNTATDWRNKLVFMTDGTLINMIVRNELGGLSAIMIDEAHERSLNIDLILGLLKAQLPRFRQLKLIVASATINSRRFLEYFGAPAGFDPDAEPYSRMTQEGFRQYDNARIDRDLAESPVGFYGFPGKRQFPVEERYRQGDPIPEALWPGQMPDEVADKVLEILLAMRKGAEPEGDILAFLHGEKPIEHCVEAIHDRVAEEPSLAGKVDVLPLYTKLPQHRQDAALKPKKDAKRIRVIVSTNVAETSLTVEGIVHVVDSALINESQWDPQTQTTFVVPKIHSQAGCRQRWGRAGRVMPGVAHCLYTREQFARFPAYTDPEIVRAPLEQIVLTAKAAGVDDVRTFEWIQRPPDAELERAPQYLRDIGALDQDGDLTDHGLELRSFADETDVANLMILADRLGCAVEMATLLPMRKLGGYTPLLLWDKGWDAPTKRAVNRIHQGLLRPCLDDLELSLKLWDAWEGARFGRTDSRQRSTWAQRFFVNHNLFAEQIAAERDALLSSLSGHKKVETARPVDFDLLTRLRILMTYGLPSQIYQLGNPPQTGADMTEAPIYRPYIPNPEATPELARLHEEAVVEISPESICAGQALQTFVCGRRVRVRRRMSPLADPLTIITASFVTLIKPQWLHCIGQPAIAVARLIAAESRNPDGSLIQTTTRSRLFIDQTYPIGVTLNCQAGEATGPVSVLGLAKNPPRIVVRRSHEEVEGPDDIEILEPERRISRNVDAEEKARTAMTSGEEDSRVWIDLLGDDDEDAAPGKVESIGAPPEAELFPGRIVHAPGGHPTAAPFLGIVTGYDFSDRQRPTILLEMPIEPAPFDQFVAKGHRPGADLKVRVAAVERYVNDRLAYLIVRGAETGMEIVMDPYDTSLIGRNFAVEILEPGTTFDVTLEETDVQARRVRITRLKAGEAEMLRFLGKGDERIVDAQIVDVRDNGLYLWLDPASTRDNTPCAAFVYVDRLPQRPEDMWLGQGCKVRIRQHQWKRPLRRSIPDLPVEIEAKLRARRWDGKLRWEPEDHALVVERRMTYHERLQLLDLSPLADYQRTINVLFRRSNELDVRVLDMTGAQNLLPYQGQKAPGKWKVTQVLDDAVWVQAPDGFETYVPKREVVYDQSQELKQVVAPGREVEAFIQEVNLDVGQAKVSLLRPEDDPLNKYREGQPVAGQVVNALDYAAWVEIEPGVQGRVHVSEMAWYRVERVADVLSRGQPVKARILTIDRKERRVDLSMRLPESDPFRKYEVNQRYIGKVVAFTKDGNAAFVELEPGVEGFLWRDEIDVGQVTSARAAVQEGQRLPVRITEIDREERKLRLTVRGLFEDRLTVPASHQGLIIGKAGAVIQGICKQTRTAIDLEDDGQCTIQGKELQDVQEARKRIETILATRVVETMIQQQQVPMLIGGGGKTIQAIQGASGAHVSVDDCQLTVTAANDWVLQDCLSRIREAITFYEVTIRVPPGLAGRVVGTEGSIRKAIEAQTGTRIFVSKDGTGTVRIEGRSRASVEQAWPLIQAKTGSATYVSSAEGTLPPMRPVRPDVVRRLPAKAQKAATPILSRQPAIPAASVSRPVAAVPKPIPAQPQVYQAEVYVPVASLPKLLRKQGGLLVTLFGGGKTQIDKIQESTGTEIRINSTTGVVRLTGPAQNAVDRAVQALQMAVAAG